MRITKYCVGTADYLAKMKKGRLIDFLRITSDMVKSDAHTRDLYGNMIDKHLPFDVVLSYFTIR